MTFNELELYIQRTLHALSTHGSVLLNRLAIRVTKAEWAALQRELQVPIEKLMIRGVEIIPNLTGATSEDYYTDIDLLDRRRASVRRGVGGNPVVSNKVGPLANRRRPT